LIDAGDVGVGAGVTGVIRLCEEGTVDGAGLRGIAAAALHSDLHIAQVLADFRAVSVLLYEEADGADSEGIGCEADGAIRAIDGGAATGR
jgi:hypothetical protein